MQQEVNPAPLDAAALTEKVLLLLDDLKAKDPVVLDVTEQTSVTDRMVIATGNSSRQVAALARHLVDELKKEQIHPLSVEGQDASDWVLVDLGDVLVHIMQQEARDYYALEKLWGELALPSEQVAEG
ncbi:ribosome silencing factor [Marinospirillum sp.]|uniref:ribosome silencing factor n=1 Tax=Marinospirillum sp. TaxID=2183934 RepID=UPI003A83D8FB